MFLQCGYWFTAPFRSCNVTSVICFPVGAIRTITTTKNILIKNWLRFVKKKTTKTTEMNSILQEDLRELGGVGWGVSALKLTPSEVLMLHGDL